MKDFFSHFRDHLVPHRRNGHRPHILRTEFAFAFLMVVLVSESFLGAHVFNLVPSLFSGASVFSRALVDLANADRAEAEAPSLTLDPLLSRAAQMKADDMAANGYFAHESPSGATPWSWLEKVGYSYSYAGENLAVNYTDSIDVQRAWMASPEHRDNIVKKEFEDVGIGIAEGIYLGRPATFVVQMLGTKERAIALAEKAATPSRAAAPLFEHVEENARAETVVPALSQITPRPEAAVLASSPRHALSYAYAGFVAIFLFALFFLVWHRKHTVHPRLAWNGALVVGVLLLSLFGNMYASQLGTVSFDAGGYLEKVQ
ncbi:MAG: CAP domain-containing protein [Patescibacteria group bacterium]